MRKWRTSEWRARRHNNARVSAQGPRDEGETLLPSFLPRRSDPTFTTLQCTSLGFPVHTGSQVRQYAADRTRARATFPVRPCENCGADGTCSFFFQANVNWDVEDIIYSYRGCFASFKLRFCIDLIVLALSQIYIKIFKSIIKILIITRLNLYWTRRKINTNVFNIHCVQIYL